MALRNRICIREDKRVDRSLWNKLGTITEAATRKRWVDSKEEEYLIKLDSPLKLDSPPEHDPLLTEIWLEPSMWDAASEAKVEIDNSTQQPLNKTAKG